MTNRHPADDDPPTVEIDYVRVLRETDEAYRLSVPAHTDDFGVVWIPKSLVSAHDEDEKTMEIPEWLALEKGLT